MWGFFLLMCSCNYFHEKPVVLNSSNLHIGSKLCFVGDTGSGKKHQYDVAKILEKASCSEIHLMGDIIYSNGLKSASDSSIEKKFFIPYKKLLESTPFYVSLGNHDYKGLTSVWYQLAKTHENIIFPAPFYHRNNNGLCITTLDTNAFFIKQLLWLDSLKEEFLKCQFSIFTGHHPFQSSGDHGDSPYIVKKFIHNAIRDFTKIYISGHEHQLSDEGEIDGVRFFISGAGGKLRPLRSTPKIWGRSAPGFLSLSIKSLDPFIIKFDFYTIDSSESVHSGVITQ